MEGVQTAYCGQAQMPLAVLLLMMTHEVPAASVVSQYTLGGKYFLLPNCGSNWRYQAQGALLEHPKKLSWKGQANCRFSFRSRHKNGPTTLGSWEHARATGPTQPQQGQCADRFVRAHSFRVRVSMRKQDRRVS